jgi:hypothetical protein
MRDYAVTEVLRPARVGHIRSVPQNHQKRHWSLPLPLHFPLPRDTSPSERVENATAR